MLCLCSVRPAPGCSVLAPVCDIGCGASKAKNAIDEALLVSVRADDAAGVIGALARHGAEIITTDERGMTALMYASVLGHEAAVSALIAKRANLNKKDCNNTTAAMHAAYVGKYGVLQQLEHTGAELSPGCR